MKKTVKGYVLGFLSAILLIALATSVYATATARTRTLTVTYGHIRLVVNGELITPRDGQGNEVHPFVSAGTTYLPVRALADALGQEVRWDGATSTVYIGSNTNPNDNPTPTPPAGSGTEPITPTPTPDPPVTTPQPTAPPRQFNMNDPNVRLIPNFATSTTMEELRAAEEARLGVAHGGWQSAQEIIAHQRHPDNMIGDQTFYEWRMVPIQNWVDSYLRTNGIDISNMTDYEKTAVIRRIIEEGHLEAFIGLWRPNFRFGLVAGRGDCAPRSEAIHFMMIAMDFELFRQISGSVNLAHGFNAYWDSTVGAIRFVDADLGFDVWNLFVDELDTRGFSIWAP